MYQNGKGVPQDYLKAIEYFTLSAEQGNAFGCCHLGTFDTSILLPPLLKS